MDRERAVRALEMCREELRKACVARNRVAVHYWALQFRDNREWLRRYVASEEPELRPPG
jgi:hypothetical protein